MRHHRQEVIDLLVAETAEWRETTQQQQQASADNISSSNGTTSKTGGGLPPSSPRPGSSGLERMNGSGSGLLSSPRLHPGLKSPVKFPPRGVFGVTSPERGSGGVKSVSGSPIL